MEKRQIFYSFHYANDVMRVQQIRNIGMLEDNSPVSPNEWEKIKRSGDREIEKWIDNNMKYRSCVVVLIGTETASRPWVQYEIRKAWADGKGLLGIYIHNIRDPRMGICRKGANPFAQFELNGKILLILFHVMIRIRGMLITIFVIISKIGLKMQYELGASIERVQWK